MLTGHPVLAADCNGGVTVNPSGVFDTCSQNSWEAHAKNVGGEGAASALQVGFDSLRASRMVFANVALETVRPAKLP